MIAAGDLTPAGAADVPAAVALINLAYRGARAPGWSSEAGYIEGDRTTEPQLHAEIAASPAASLLLWRDRSVLSGCVWLEPLSDGKWYLGSLAVDPARQGEGVGDAMLSAAEAWTRARGGACVRLTVVNVRIALIEWYERRGYRQTGETSAFPYGDNRFGVPLRDDLRFVVLEKALAA